MDETRWVITTIGSINFLTLCGLIYKIGNFTGIQSTQILNIQADIKRLEERVGILGKRTHDFASTAMVIDMIKQQVERLETVVDKFHDN